MVKILQLVIGSNIVLCIISLKINLCKKSQFLTFTPKKFVKKCSKKLGTGSFLLCIQITRESEGIISHPNATISNILS